MKKFYSSKSFFNLTFSDEIYYKIYKEIFKDDNYSYIKAKTKESSINNLKNLITQLSKNLEMDLKYIDVEAIINKKDKKSVKYLLVLFINILKIKELAKHQMINRNFDNQIEKYEKKNLTEIKNINKNKNNSNYFLSKKEFINEIIKIIQSIIPKNQFYDFLINDSFNEKFTKIIEKIYILHFQIFNNILISKQFLSDYLIDIKYIIFKNLYILNKSLESKKISNNNENIIKFSKILKNKKNLKKYYTLNQNKIMKESKLNKYEYENQRKKSYKVINEFCKLNKKLTQIKKEKDLENLEFQELLFKLKFYQSLEQKVSIINNLRKNNNKAKIEINKLI